MTVSLEPASTTETQVAVDTVAADSAKEHSSGSAEQDQAGVIEKCITEDADRDTTLLSDNASISEQDDSCSSSEEQKECSTKPEQNNRAGVEGASESAVIEDIRDQDLLARSRVSLSSEEKHQSPAAPSITNTGKQNGMLPCYMDVSRNVGSVKPETDVAAVASVYRDYSRLPCAEGGNNIVGTSATSGKEPPFPVKLHKILSKLEFADVVSWLPHGRSWRVLKPKAFEEKVVPLYFRHAKYASFMRQVNGWGFKRMTQGPDHNSYYHELFLRGLPHLCLKMRRPARAKAGSADSDINPDFYRLSMVAPLPNPGSPAVKENGLQGIHDLGAMQSNALASLANFQPSALGLPVHGMPNGGLANMNFPNLGMNGFSAPNISANALLQQQIHNQFQPRLGNVGQQLGVPAGPNGVGNNALGVADANTAMTQQIGALRQRREDLVRQLQMINNGNGSGASSIANTTGNAGEQANPSHSSNPTSSTLQPNLSLLPSDHSHLLSNNVGANTAQLQQIMMSQLQAASMNGQNGNIMPHQPFGGIDISSSGMQQLGLSNIAGPVGGNVINPQLLMQHNAMNGALGVPGMNNSLIAPGLGNLGFMIQNQMLPNHHGSFQPMSNQNSSISGQANLQLSNDRAS